MFSWVPTYELRRFALFAFSRNESGENAFKRQWDTVCPFLQFLNEPFANQDSLERDENVVSEALHPAILHCAKPMCVRALGLEVAKQACINPARTHFRQRYLRAYFRFGMA